jgi:hypothetical protein
MLASAEKPPMRLETNQTFAVDPAFLDSGGVQYSFTLLSADKKPATRAEFQAFRPFDMNSFYEPSLHVVMSRIVYQVEKDVAFFSEARIRDVTYMNAIGEGYNISSNTDGTFKVGKTPSNTMALRYFSRVSEIPEAIAAALFGAQHVQQVVFQENTHFARIMGMRTGALGVTWTAHESLGPGRTRIHVFTMSYLYNLPPVFLGGEKRVFRESVEGALQLISALRAYSPKDDEEKQK